MVESVGTPLMWWVFGVVVVTALALDLFVFHREAHEVRFREAATWVLVWVSLACSFGVWIWYEAGSVRGLEFFAGYLVEQALSVDNIFVFIIIFKYFGTPPEYRHRVLFWGVLGALVMRAAFILAGGAFLQRFHWAIYVFGALLAITGVKLLVQRNQEMHPERNPLVRWVQKVFPATSGFHGDKFLVLKNGRRYATPLLLALVAVEVTDLIFAVDSIPAIFAVTWDPFIVFTSNIFAILGLRSLYFVLAGMMERWRYLGLALSLILLFIGGKMLASGVIEVPIAVSLSVIMFILVVAAAASTRRPAATDG